jgi:hypothetical protein
LGVVKRTTPEHCHRGQMQNAAAKPRARDLDGSCELMLSKAA